MLIAGDVDGTKTNLAIFPADNEPATPVDRMILIEPSILSADLLRLGEQAKAAEDAKADGLQLM